MAFDCTNRGPCDCSEPRSCPYAQPRPPMSSGLTKLRRPPTGWLAQAIASAKAAQARDPVWFAAIRANWRITPASRQALKEPTNTTEETK